MQLVEQPFTQHIIIVLVPQEQIHYLPKKQSQASPAPVTNADNGCQAGTQANSFTGQLHSDSGGDTTASSVIVTYTVCSAYAVPVPPGDRRAAGPRAPRPGQAI